MQPRNLCITASIIGMIAMGAVSAHANTSTQDFIEKASVANEFEIESSNLALHKSQNGDVKNFAQRMVDDHTKAGEKMKKALENSRFRMEPDETLDDKHQDLLNQLDEASGRDFDRQYIFMQTKAHKEAVVLFSDYSRHGKDPALRNFAAKTLPTLKEHLKHVEHLEITH